MLAAANAKKTTIEKKAVITPKPIIVKKPVVAEKITLPRNTINIIKKRQNKYYIIAASYSQESKAMELALEYLKLGFPVEIISANKKFRVTLNSHINKQKAIKLRDSLRIKLKRKDFWLLRY